MPGLHRSSSPPLKNGLPPQELLDDLCSRFVLNVPKEDQQSFERIFFLVEYAHWFYEDNTAEKKNPSLKSFNLKEFTSLLFNICDVLRPHVAHTYDLFKDFTDYKVRVPVTGAIILDETYERRILVKVWKGKSWSIPHGKKNKDEEDHACAIREVPMALFCPMFSDEFCFILVKGSMDTGPGKSFRNFRFDSAAILRALEAGFSA
ncbi:mRNA-decapping enzyme subunit 2-like [Hibiscus syriacus]|uniref:mRNA-decapping enzyme subunit 2-like n=1 Tax=Hibiscus syriacus TaxID=106335 RepID=UPI0019230CD7|nr:mRNA-decapping enzyme subunit 2-like [Hibiscus syriacus]